MGGFVGQGIPDNADLPPDSPEGGEGVPPEGDEPDPEGQLQGEEGTEGAEGGEGEGEGDLSTEGEGDGTGEGASSTPEFDKLVKKYGGDREALARAYMNQANSMSDMDGRLRNLEQFVQGQQTQAPTISQEERQQIIADSSDVVEASEDLQSIEADIRDEQANYTGIIKELGTAEKAVARLEGRLEAALDEDRPQIRAELASANSEHKRLLSQYRDSDRTLKKHATNMKRAQRRMVKAEKQADAEVDRTLKQQRDDDAGTQEVRAEFARVMIDEAKDRDIPTNSKKFKVLFDSIQSRLWAYTQTLPEDADPINIESAVKSLTGEYFEEFGGESFQGRSRTKRKATTSGKGSPPPPANSDRTPKGGSKPMTAAQWDARAKRLLGG